MLGGLLFEHLAEALELPDERVDRLEGGLAGLRDPPPAGTTRVTVEQPGVEPLLFGHGPQDLLDGVEVREVEVDIPQDRSQTG